MKMFSGTTEGQIACKWNVFFGLICYFLGLKKQMETEITNLRSPQLVYDVYVLFKRDSCISNSRIIIKSAKVKAKELYMIHGDNDG